MWFSFGCKLDIEWRISFKFLGNSYVYKTKHEVRDISACEVCLQIGAQTDEINVMSMLLVQIIDDPCFDILRTKFVNVNYYTDKSYFFLHATDYKLPILLGKGHLY